MMKNFVVKSYIFFFAIVIRSKYMIGKYIPIFHFFGDTYIKCFIDNTTNCFAGASTSAKPELPSLRSVVTKYTTNNDTVLGIKRYVYPNRKRLETQNDALINQMPPTLPAIVSSTAQHKTVDTVDSTPNNMVG